MRILITGGGGYLGGGLIRSAPAGFEVHATQRSTPVAGATAHPVELSDPEQVRALWSAVRPDLVIHTAYSMADGARDIVDATRNVVAACVERGAELVHLGTDLVLDGERAPYAEEAEPRPVHQYGRWKTEAESEVRSRLPQAAVVRTSLITGFDPPDPRTRWVLDGLRGRTEVSLYVDEIRCPIPLEDLAAQIWEIVALPAAERAGVWHLAGPEALSRYALGTLIAAAYGLPADGVAAARSADSSERRPRDLRLLTGRADRQLRTRARGISELALRRVAPGPGPG